MKSITTTVAIVAAATALCLSSADAAPPSLKFPAGVIKPPLSTKGAQYLAAHPDVFANLVARLPRSDQRLAPRALPPTSPWTFMTGSPSGLCDAHLMHNGNVLAHPCESPNWYKLTPSSTGSYVGGTWTSIASLPVIGGTQYAPLYFASDVLMDGRLWIQGGEYNNGANNWTNLGAIYSQSANTWTAVPAPSGITQVGDAESVELANGRVMLGTCCNNPAQDFLFNPSTLTWSTTGAPAGYQDEQGYELLPSGKVLTINVWAPPGTQLYNATSGTWAAGTNIPVVLPDTCGTAEMGPTVVRGDNKTIAFGADTCGVNPDPTAIRDNSNGAWTAGPTIPTVCGGGGTSPCSLADAPGALEPNGRILFGASAGFANAPTHFFEMKLVGNAIIQVGDHPDGASLPNYTFNSLVLPTGQIMMLDQSNAYVYTSTLAPVSSWAPTISTYPSNVTRGSTTYTITGTQLNGVSAGAYYGDDWQSFTNFPLVRVVNNSTGQVVYGNTSSFSDFSIASGHSGSFKFTLPGIAQTGAAKLYVVANGIASAGKSITVH